jgi:hypothetical protein
MKKSDYIQIASEIEKIENEFEILDLGNCFERKRAAFLMAKLISILEELERPKLRIIKSEELC